MIKLTQDQFDALIEYIDAKVQDSKPSADLFEAVAVHRALEKLEKAMLSDNVDETLD